MRTATPVLALVLSYRLPGEWIVGTRVRAVTGNPETPSLGAVLDADTGLGSGGTPEAGLPDRDPALDTLPPGLTTLDVVDLSFDAMQDLLTRYRHATFPPDLLVTVPKNACRTLDFHKAAAMVELGRQRAEEALDSATGFPPATPRSSG